jgi:hypothetical protein
MERTRVAAERELDLREIEHLVIAGWTGKDVAALEHHIRELEAIGVKRPKSTPIFYRVAASLLTTANTIDVLGERTSGEVECVVYELRDGLWIGVGSDHTDREVETLGVAWSKQVCAKPVSQRLWAFDDVAQHWDRLVVRSFAQVDGKRRLYQEGSVASMRPPSELIRLYVGNDVFARGTSMFCGTLAVQDGIAPAEQFGVELEDPVLGRKITHSYRIRTLPIEG